MRLMYIIFLFLLFGILAIVILRQLYKKYNKRKVIVAQDTNKKTKTGELIYFYTTWCPYCKKADTPWTEFREDPENKKIKGYNITYTKVDCDLDEATARKYDVKSYPTIKLKCEGDVVDFDAKPTVEDLRDFLETVLP